MAFWKRRNGTVIDTRVDVLPIRLKHTHGMCRRGFRIHRIKDAEAHHADYEVTPEYRVSARTVCQQFLREDDLFGTPESLAAVGGVLCPRCHPCRCATPCQAQCVCSTKCGECAPGQDGTCRYRPAASVAQEVAG